MRRQSSGIALAAGLIALTGCAEDGPELIEHKGAQYERTNYDELRDLFPTGVAGNETDPFADWSVEELADALRPTISRGGNVYVAVEPARAAARAMLEGDQTEFQREWAGPRPGRPAPLNEAGFRKIIDADGRTIVDPSQYPFSAIARVELRDGNVPMEHCTGFFVGQFTLVTSAHCLYEEHSELGLLVADVFRIQPMRDGLNVPEEFVCHEDDFYNHGVPAGFVGAGVENAENPFDYAVIDVFPCMPQGASSFFPNYFVNPGSGHYGMYGYAEDCGGGDRQCGMAGPANHNGLWIETEHIDATGGQSGAPWYATNWTMPAAVNQGYRSYPDLWQCGFASCQRNFGRRIDWGVDEFIRAVSWDF